jgi:DNA-binding response OmpR family regulator
MASGHRPLILVLEDEWMIASLIQAALEDAGFEVIGPVGRIGEALALMQRERCDAAVLDINVHGERSFSVAKRLSEMATPFVFMSGYSAAELPAGFRETPLLEKPLDLGALCRRISALLEN